MFGDLGYCTRVEQKVLKVSHDALIMDKWSKIYGLYILIGSTIIIHASLDSKHFHDNTNICNLRSWNDSERRTDNGLNLVS